MSASPLSVYFSVCSYVSLFVLPLPEDSSRQRNKESVLWILCLTTPAAASPSVASNTHPHTPTHTLPLLSSFDFPLTPTRPFLLHCSGRCHGNWSSCWVADTESESFICLCISACKRARECTCMNANVCVRVYLLSRSVCGPAAWYLQRCALAAMMPGQGWILFTNISHMASATSSSSSSPHPLALPPAPGLNPNMCHSGVWPGVLWRWLKEKSVATAGVATQSASTEGRRKRINKT